MQNEYGSDSPNADITGELREHGRVVAVNTTLKETRKAQQGMGLNSVPTRMTLVHSHRRCGLQRTSSQESRRPQLSSSHLAAAGQEADSPPLSSLH